MLYLFSRQTVKGSVRQGVLLVQNSGSCFCEVVSVDQCALLFACLDFFSLHLSLCMEPKFGQVLAAVGAGCST